MKTRNKLFLALSLAASFSGAAYGSTSQPKLLDEEVRIALVKIPYLSVFDNLSYRVDNGVVTLSGEALQPMIKVYAEQNVKAVAGVTGVRNQIEVLPLSPFDDDIRWRTLRAVQSTSSLYRYFLGANPSIRIVVKNGHVTLGGIVSNEGDKQLAFMVANRVPYVFSVTNNLRTASQL